MSSGGISSAASSMACANAPSMMPNSAITEPHPMMEPRSSRAASPNGVPSDGGASTRPLRAASMLAPKSRRDWSANAATTHTAVSAMSGRSGHHRSYT